jgi:uncharacterized membrane protein YgdD (TMEM256/DUF423 family)
MYHAFALIIAGLAGQTTTAATARRFRVAGRLFTIGIVLFSGSLYCLVLFNAPWLGAITPLGGIAFVGGWILLTIAILRPQ